MNTERMEEGDPRWESISSNLKTIGGAVLLALVIRTCLFEAFEIEGPSMEPTLLNRDRVVVAKFIYGLFLPLADEAIANWGGPSPGDVVIIKSPADGVDIVKRVIGVGGDKIELRGDIVYRNGAPIPVEDVGECQTGSGMFKIVKGKKVRNRDCRWTRSRIGDQVFRTSTADPSVFDRRPITIPPGHIYVLGDHRDQSNDSRVIGTIPNNRVKGLALSIYWPMGRWFSAVQ